MAYISTAVRRATISIRQRTAIVLLGVGVVATFAWTGFLAYTVVAAIKRLT